MNTHDERHTESTEACRPLQERDGGFVLPAVIFGLVIMSTVAAAAIYTANDDHRSSSAQVQSQSAFYAAEAGLHEVWSNWPEATVSALGPGQSADLGWYDLAAGGSYKTEIQRLDDDSGSQPPIYQVRIEGRGPGARGGRRVLSMTFRDIPPGQYTIGECCEATVTTRGTVEVQDTTVLSGLDARPTQTHGSGGWTDDVCSTQTNDQPGLIVQDMDDIVEIEDESTVQGEPDIKEDPSIDDSTFEDFGPLTWDEIRARADHVVGEWGDSESVDVSEVYPRTTVDGDGNVVCDTSHPYNWGSDDPTHPCYNYFPVILIQGEMETHGTPTDQFYGQGTFIIDWDDSRPVGEKGGEWELEDYTTMNGLILGKGCVEIQKKNTQFYGAVFVDGNFRNEHQCGSDEDMALKDRDAQIHYSQCAIDRALINGNLADAVTAQQGSETGLVPLGRRPFAELFR